MSSSMNPDPSLTTNHQSLSTSSKVYVAGHTGLVGSAIMGRLKAEGFTNIITRELSELDLRDQKAAREFFEKEKPEYVFLAAAKVGNIKAYSNCPADFIYDNLAIELNVIKAAYDFKVKKLLFFGSSSIYPKQCSQPMKEEHLLTGPLDPTNESYAIAKIAGLKMCQYFNKQFETRFITINPPNLYGPRDDFDLETSHVIPSLIRRFHEAKLNKSSGVLVWGSGNARREFMFVDDLAYAVHRVLSVNTEHDVINAGVGNDVSIRELAETISEVVGYGGAIAFDSSKPEGMPRKLLDNSRILNLGWEPKTALTEGLQITYEWFLRNLEVDHAI